VFANLVSSSYFRQGEHSAAAAAPRKSSRLMAWLATLLLGRRRAI
jgi:hypothetical protein